MAEEKNPNVGAIWIKDGEPLSIKLHDEQYLGKQNENKKTDSQPDYRIFKVEDGAETEVGAAWSGETKAQRQKLSIKMQDGKYYTAVMRDSVEGQQPDMNILG